MAAIPALLLFLVLHGVFFHDVASDERSLSAATLTAGLTPRGPVDAPADPGVPHVLDVEGAAWVDEPSPYLARAAFAAGELPLWNPGSGLGTPLAANLNSGAGNPLQLPLNLLPGPAAADVFYLGRLLVLALCTWAFLRELGVTSMAAVVGATITAYGGYPMAWIAHHPLSTEIFLPLMLFGFERGRRGRAGGWVVLVLAAAAALLGGKLQASLLCFGFVGVYALQRGSTREGGVGSPTVAVTVLGLVLGGVAAAFLLVPAAELTARASGLTLGGRAQLAGYTVPWPSLVSLAVPRLFAAPGRVFGDGLLMPGVGIAALVLAGVGMAAYAAPLVRVARLCGLWALVFLLRNAGAFGDLALRLPAVRGILFLKYTFTIVFALAVAAAIGFDAVLAGRIDDRRASRMTAAVLLVLAIVAAVAVTTNPTPTFPLALHAPVLLAGILAIVVGLWRGHVIHRRTVAVLFAAIVVGELWSFVPHHHPPRLDPYRAPAFVDFLRSAPRGRVIADPDLLVPLTSAAVGLEDLRAIDVLTPGAYYAFFTRLVSFCDRVIHFTVDPDLAVAATAPALDLVGVRYVASRRPLVVNDLAIRVRNQVGRERTARLLAGLVRLRSEGDPLAIGPVAVADDERFAFTLTTPFTLDLTAESEAAELAWGALVRGTGAGVALRVVVDGIPSDAPSEPLALATGDRWAEQRVALAQAGERRRVRVRLSAASLDEAPAQVSLGSLGFSPGEGVEARLAGERAFRQAAELAALQPVFRDPAFGVVVYENTNALPRAFRVRRVEPTASEDAALTRLGDGFDFRRTALVMKADVTAVAAQLTGGTAAPGEDGGTAEIRRETPGSVTVATDGTAPALLVLADLAFPGWQADLDGRDVPVLTVDGLLRGVVVPAGAHVVAFRYRPASWLVGAALSGLALLALMPYARAGARSHGSGGAA
jgi:hypothetical protein